MIDIALQTTGVVIIVVVAFWIDAKGRRMKRVIKAVIATVKARRALRAALADGAADAAVKRLRRALSAALDELEIAAMSFKPERPNEPLDWKGMGRALTAGLKLVGKLHGAKTSREMVDVIEGEIVD